MKNVSRKNIWRNSTVKIHMDTHLVTLIKSKLDLKTERDYVKSKLRRITTSEEYYMYELKVDLFDNGNP